MIKKVSQSAGGGFWQEGNEQELFVDIEVIETASHHKTGTIDVDVTAFGTDPQLPRESLRVASKKRKVLNKIKKE
jgi:hypothetical protein